MSDPVYKPSPDEEDDFYSKQRERAERKERFNSLNDSDSDAVDNNYSPADDDTDNVVSLDEFRKKKEASAGELKDQEATFGKNDSDDDQSNEEEAKLFKPENDKKSGMLSRVQSGAAILKKRRGLSLALGAGGIGAIMGFVMLLVMLSSMKVLHFGQLLSTSGFIRLNSIMEERTSQIVFDNAATVGEGDVSLRGRSLLDKITFRNLDDQVAELGQQKKIKFVLNEGEFQGIKLPSENKTITLDGITKELGFGEKFSDIGKGWSRLNPNDYRRVATVRNEFVKQARVGINEGLATESRAVRGRVNKIISDNIGFKYSRWREKARDYLGLKPEEASIKNTVDLADEVSGTEITETGVTDLDLSQKQLKNASRIEEFMKKNGGIFDKEKFISDVMAGETKGKTIQNFASKAGVGVMIGTLACMANQAMSRVDEIAATNERQAEKQASLQMAAKDQQLQGEANDEAIGAEASSLDNGETAPWYQYTQYGEVTDATVSAPRIRPKYGNIATLIQTISSPSRFLTGPAALVIPDDVLKSTDTAFCNALLSPAGAGVALGAEVIATAAASFFSGGGAAAVEQGGGRVLISTMVRELASASFNTVTGVFSKESLAVLGGVALYQLGLEFAVRQLSATDFMGAEQGAAKVENTGVGASLLQSRRLRAAAGAPMKNVEAKEVDEPYMKQKRASLNGQGVFARYFSIENPYSMIGSLSANVSLSGQSPGSLAGNLLSKAASVMTNGGIFKPLLRPILGASPQAHAAVDYNPYFDVVQWGYTASELNLMRTDPSYSFFFNRDHISDQRITELDKTYSDCFNPEILQVEIEDTSKYPQCTEAELRKDDEMFRYRLTKLDGQLEDMLSKKPNEIRQPVDGSITSTDSGPESGDAGTGQSAATDGSTCATGTRDLGTADTYINGSLTPSKVCAITGFKSTSSESQSGNAFSVPGANGDTIVSASASSKFVNLFNAMKAAGQTPTANSSFRTMAHQQQLCNANALCRSGTYTRVAKPGTSNHQGGNAIDFGNCSTRVTSCYAWLSANASKYGIYNYPEEAWHWSTTGK